MHKFLIFGFFISLISCSENEDMPSVSSSMVSFQLTGVHNLTERFKDTLVEVEKEIVANENYNYVRETKDSVLIVKHTFFNFYRDSSSPNQCEELSIRLEKMEDKNNLRYDNAHDRWSYKSLSAEYSHFYKNYDSAFVEINLCYLRTSFSADKNSGDFNIKRIAKALVLGKEEWLISASFRGKSQNSYDPDDILYFEIQNGKFEGILR